MLTMQELAKLLRDNGCKVTPQRLAVYDMLAHTKEHPTAEMIFDAVKEKYPSMSFATVYKSVEIFSRLHIIQVLNTGEDSFRYDARVDEHPISSVCSAAGCGIWIQWMPKRQKPRLRRIPVLK